MKFDQEEMRRLAGRYFAGEIAAEEERELFRFVTSDAACRRQFAAWRLEWEAMPASDAATDRDWRRLRSRIRLQGSARSARPGRFAAVWRAAAAVAVVCATFFGARLYDRLLLERATERYTVTTKSGRRFHRAARGDLAPPGRVAHLRPFRRDHGHHARQHGAVPGLDRRAHRVHRRDDRAVVREPEQPLRR